MNFQSKSALIWNIADLLRGGWKQHEYQDVILPLTVLKRLDSLLIPTKDKVLKSFHQFEGKINLAPVLEKATGYQFYNVSEYDFDKLLDDQTNIVKNFEHYLNGFSENVQEIIEKFDFTRQLERLSGGNLLYLILKEFKKVDLHPDKVSNLEMGYIFEELIRKFNEENNEEAGEHFTPREVIDLMNMKQFVKLLKNKKKKC